MYTEASMGSIGESAAIYSPRVASYNTTNCLKFWYHMYGPHIGTLKVEKKYLGLNEMRKMWSLSGNQGYKWQEAMIELPASQRIYRISFNATRGNGHGGDIALDDVHFTGEPCVKTGESCFQFQIVHMYN